MITVCKKIEELNEMQETWSNLLAQSPCATPYQSFAYVKSSWENIVKEGELHIISVIREKDKLLQAILPCYLDKRGILRMINDINTDFCAPIVLPEFEYDYHFYSEVSDYIKETPEIKGFMFDDLKEDCHLTAIMEYFFKGSIVRMTNKWSLMVMDSCADDYLQSIKFMNNKDRYKLKKMSKKCEKLEFKFLDKSNGMSPAPILEELVNSMTSSGLRTEAYFTKEFMNVIYDCYNAGILTVAVTYKDGEAMAANLYMINGNEYIDWLAVYKEGQYNTFNLLQMLEYIYNHGGGSLNFARGQYDYKIRNFKPVLHCLYRITYTKSKFGQFKNWLDATKYYLKTVVKPYVRK